jgi:3-hydroxyacyl-CoA dehydrogenase
LKLGANHPIGPLAFDLIGLDVILHVMETLYRVSKTPSTAPARCSSRWSSPATSAAKPAGGFYKYEQ